jgi:hypothetical protein
VIQGEVLHSMLRYLSPVSLGNLTYTLPTHHEGELFHVTGLYTTLADLSFPNPSPQRSIILPAEIYSCPRDPGCFVSSVLSMPIRGRF